MENNNMGREELLSFLIGMAIGSLGEILYDTKLNYSTRRSLEDLYRYLTLKVNELHYPNSSQETGAKENISQIMKCSMCGGDHLSSYHYKATGSFSNKPLNCE